MDSEAGASFPMLPNRKPRKVRSYGPLTEILSALTSNRSLRSMNRVTAAITRCRARSLCT